MKQIDNIIEQFDKVVEKWPDRVAVKQSDTSLTFTELRARAQLISGQILSMNIGPNRPVIIFLPKSFQYLEVIVGILYTGNFYVPIDAKTPFKRLQIIIQNANPSLVITHSTYRDLFSPAGISDSKVLFLDEIHASQLVRQTAAPLIRDRQARLIDTDPLYIIYTSGSTGVPKGVVISHRSVIDYISWAANKFQIDHTSIIGNQSPFHFDNSTLDIYLCLMCGASFVVIPEEKFIYPAELIEYINRQEVNFIFWVPSMLVNIASLDIFNDILPQTLTKILFAGEVMPVKHLNYWRRHLPQVLFANLYGPTEITVDCTYYIVDREFEENEVLPIGFPCHNTSILILNDENQPTKKGEIGELCVRGSSLALGYYNDFEKTNKAFHQNPLNTNYPERIYRTGDLVYINPREELIFCGRKDHQIKHMGYRIELGEIESNLLSIDGIINACVIYDASKKQIAAFYLSKGDISPSFLKEEMSRMLPPYMTPRLFKKLDSFPLNPNGKIDRLALSEGLGK